MKNSARTISIGILAALLGLPAIAQVGSGGIGSANLGFRSTGSTRGYRDVSAEDAIPGRWRMEFRIRRYSDDPEASGRWMTVIADMWIGGIYVNGQIRDGNISADFNCHIDEHGRCLDGKIRFQGQDYDWQDFAFITDREGDRAEGWAVYVDRETGATREYEIVMRKR